MAAELNTAQIAWHRSPSVRRFRAEMARRRTEEARRIGANIKALRERHHLTQEAAAAKIKVAYRTYQSWEEGTAVPRWHNRERVASAYNVGVEEVNGPPSIGEASSQMERIETDLRAVVEELASQRSLLEALSEAVEAQAGNRVVEQSRRAQQQAPGTRHGAGRRARA